MRIKAVVEGHGEVNAVPELLRRLAYAAAIHSVETPAPVRAHRADLLDEAKLRTKIELARLDQPDAILILFDADDDCPKEIVARLGPIARDAAHPIPCEVVLANREYEAWFLASLESLRGVRGIVADAEYPDDPEIPRDAKGRVSERMTGTRRYSETADQAALTACFDMGTAYLRCRSFRRIITAMGALFAGAGHAVAPWPPPEWTNP